MGPGATEPAEVEPLPGEPGPAPGGDEPLVGAWAEIAQLRQALVSRQVIDQLKGMVMFLLDCDAETAWAQLVRESQRRHVKVRELADRACTHSVYRRTVLQSVLEVSRQPRSAAAAVPAAAVRPGPAAD